MANIGENAYLPGAAALLEQLDSKLMLILRDGRHLIGILRSFDHFLNMTLESTAERVILKGKYCDIPLGLYIVRGDNIVLLGEVDDDNDNQSKLVRISVEELVELQRVVDDDGKVEWDFD